MASLKGKVLVLKQNGFWMWQPRETKMCEVWFAIVIVVQLCVKL